MLHLTLSRGVLITETTPPQRTKAGGDQRMRETDGNASRGQCGASPSGLALSSLEQES